MAQEYHSSTKWKYWGCGPDHKKGYLPFMAVAVPAAASVRAMNPEGKGVEVTPQQFVKACPKFVATDVLFGPKKKAAVACLHKNFGANATVKFGDATIGLPDIPIVSDIAGAIVGFVNLIGALFRGSTWIRIAEVVGGLVLIGAAIAMISKDLGLSNVEEAAKKMPGVASLAKLGAMTKG
jgi:hypothetical protein